MCIQVSVGTERCYRQPVPQRGLDGVSSYAAVSNQLRIPSLTPSHTNLTGVFNDCPFLSACDPFLSNLRRDRRFEPLMSQVKAVEDRL